MKLVFNLCSENLQLPSLEIQHLEADSKHEGKEDGKTDQDCSSFTHEIQVIPKMVFHIPFDGWVWCNTCYLNGVFDISILCHNQTINCPRHRADIVVPCPPLGNYLKFSIVNLFPCESIYGHSLFFLAVQKNWTYWFGNEKPGKEGEESIKC